MTNRLLAGLIVLCVCVASAIGQPSYTIEAVNGLGYGDSCIYAMNNSGAIVGTCMASESDYTSHAYIWKNGVATDLGEGEAWAINNSGQIAGAKYVGDNVRACVWSSDGQAQILDYGGIAMAINNSGLVAGTLYAGGSFVVNITAPSEYEVVDKQFIPVAINDSGLVVGTYYSKAVEAAAVWQNGSLTTNIANFPDDYFSYSRGVNSAGQVVIEYNGDFGIICRNGIVEDVGNFVPRGINDSGQMIGSIYMVHESALREADGTIYELNDLISADLNWSLDRVYCINDVGQIFGAGTFNGEMKMFLMTPVPEPGMMVLLGLAALMLRRRFAN